ncbi:MULTISPECIES: DUF5064 family protein [Pseudomonadaceae]|jgi:hypothetical protein|nr:MULTISPECIES: DUF5064 family protein [Pseudomonadaceae]RGP56899.1 hypothetical protein ASB58_06015 [Halopseudomonas gallaeciensis]|tara:strand:- start:9172 stop:9519 length:348 start_codon:yes stop_codon:yes gene_type:complete
MFEPGHLHISRLQLLPEDTGYSLDIHYSIDSQRSAVEFVVEGEINQQVVRETFSLPRDTAFNFASNIDHILRRHGVLTREFMSLSAHHEYDAMFEDIRERLNAWNGEAIDPAHLG